MERGIEGAGLNTKRLAGVRTNAMGDRITMLRAPLQGLQEKQVQRALQQFNPILVVLSHAVDILPRWIIGYRRLRGSQTENLINGPRHLMC